MLREGWPVFPCLQPTSDCAGDWRRPGPWPALSPGGAAQGLQWGQGRAQKDSALHGGRPMVGTLTSPQRKRMAKLRLLLTYQAGSARHVIRATHVSVALRDLPWRHVSERGHVTTLFIELRQCSFFSELTFPHPGLPPSQWKRTMRKRGRCWKAAPVKLAEERLRSQLSPERCRPFATLVAWRTGFWCCCWCAS